MYIGQEVWVLGRYLPRKAVIHELPAPLWSYYKLEVQPEPYGVQTEPEYTDYPAKNIYMTYEAVIWAQRKGNKARLETVRAKIEKYTALHAAMMALGADEET